jgi:protein-S-isoprenylcysteine O-methyltransferase Ste14
MRKKGMNRYSIIGWLAFLVVFLGSFYLIFFQPALEDLSENALNEDVRSLWIRGVASAGIVIVVVVLIYLIVKFIIKHSRVHRLRSEHPELQGQNR